MKRVMAIHTPFLATQRRDEDEFPIANCQLPIDLSTSNRKSEIGNWKSAIPAVTVAASGQTVRLVHVNAAAEHWRLRAGQTLAEAKAVVPQLVTYDDDPLADRDVLESLALGMQRFSPVVHIADENTLLVDVTGCERLFGGEARLLYLAVAEVEGRGFTVRAAIADTPGAAWALAHAHAESVVLSEPGQNVIDLIPLSVEALRVEAGVVESLARVGVRSVGALLHLPRSSLASRFGSAVLDRLDQALGDLPEVLTPFTPPAALEERLEWGAPVHRWDLLVEAVRRAATRFCEQLARRVGGVREAMVTFECPGVGTPEGVRTQRVTISVAMSRPTRSVKHLLHLLKVRLEGLQLLAPAEAVTVWARRVEPFDDPQTELFDTATVDARSLGDLLDRLTLRLGPAAVVRPAPVSDHQPEKAFEYASLIEKDEGKRRNAETPKCRNAKTPKRRNPEAGVSSNFELRTLNFDSDVPRPLRVSSKPVPVTAMSVVPDGPPISFQLRGQRHTIMESVGPERIETGWWRGPHVQRDYYRANLQDGRKAWLFRERRSGRWFLHGWFD